MTTRGLAHPLPLASIVVLLVNDHVLKRACPSWLTGKLSDFAGLFFFPILLVAIAELGPAARRRRSLVAAIACVATAIVFAAIKAVPACNALANRVGTFVLDPTDLVALVSVAAAWVFLDRPAPSGVARWQTGLAIVVASGASVATSRPPTEPKYPAWSVVDGGPLDVGCARVEAWIPRSGRKGFGVTVAVDAPEGCHAVVDATFRGGDVAISSNRAVLDGGGRRFAYLSLPFDNLALFDRGVEEGELLLTLDDGAPHTRVLRVRQVPVPPFGYPERASPLELTGAPAIVTSCGAVHARAERDGHRTRLVFSVAPRCHVELTGTITPMRRDPRTNTIETLATEPAEMSTKASGERVDGDFWINFRRGAFGHVELELQDGDRRILWVLDVAETGGTSPRVVVP